MWKRKPELDKRFANGDDYAGDAWENEWGGVRYVAVGRCPDEPILYDEAIEIHEQNQRLRG